MKDKEKGFLLLCSSLRLKVESEVRAKQQNRSHKVIKHNVNRLVVISMRDRKRKFKLPLEATKYHIERKLYVVKLKSFPNRLEFNESSLQMKSCFNLQHCPNVALRCL
jgi:hypothetical protein